MTDACNAPTPEEDLAIATRALAEGDLVHAAHHVAGVLAAEPERPEALALLDRIVAASDDPLGLAPLATDGPVYFGTAALRAELLARRGAIVDAFGLISEVVRVKSDVPFFAWTRRWLEAKGAARLSSEDLATIAGKIMNALVVVPSGLPEGDPRRRNAEEALRALDVVRELAPRIGLVHAASALAMRRLGRYEDAVRLAERGMEVEPSYFGAVALASARREAGDTAGSLRAFELALEHQPDDVAARLDLGDVALTERRLGDAERWYGEALEREPDHPWAQPSFLFVRHLRGDEAAARNLMLLAATQIENARAQDLASWLEPYRRSLPSPADAGAGLIATLVARGIAGTIRQGISSLESPSVRTAFRVAGEKLGTPWQLEVEVGEIQKPDPRVPRRPSRYTPWRYDGTDPSPCFGPPPADVLEQIAEIAFTPYDLARWAEDARALGRALGPARAGELVGVMLHPPPPPVAAAAVDWVYRVEIAAALALLGVDRGWQGSTRREALVGLALGPMDWTVDAAVIALARLAEHDETARAEVHEIFRELLAEIPRPGHCSYERPLVCAWSWLPDLPEADRQELARWQRALEAGDGDGA